MKMVKNILSRFTVVVTCVCIAVPLFNLMVGGVKDEVFEMLLQIIEINLMSMKIKTQLYMGIIVEMEVCFVL